MPAKKHCKGANRANGQPVHSSKPRKGSCLQKTKGSSWGLRLFWAGIWGGRASIWQAKGDGRPVWRAQAPQKAVIVWA